MTSTKKGIVRALLYAAVIGALLCPVTAPADIDPILLVYPDRPAEFHFDQSQYELLDATNDNYDPDFDVGGFVLWDLAENRIAFEVYRAPQITAFVPSSNGMNQFVLMINDFRLFIDGFGEYPRQFNEVTVRFIPDPPHASAAIVIDDSPIDFLIMTLPGLEEPAPLSLAGHSFYSSRTWVRMWWSGAVGMRIIAYGDKNSNLVYDGGTPRWSIYVHDNTIPVEETTWGSIKNLFAE